MAMKTNPPMPTHLSWYKRGRVWLSLSSLASGILLTHFILLPLQGQMGVNLVAVLEPYMLVWTHLRGLQFVMVVAARYLLLPFYVYLGYRVTRFVFSGIAGSLVSRTASTGRKGRLAGRLRRSVVLRILRVGYVGVCAIFVAVELLFFLALIGKGVVHPRGGRRLLCRVRPVPLPFPPLQLQPHGERLGDHHRPDDPARRVHRRPVPRGKAG